MALRQELNLNSSTSAIQQKLASQEKKPETAALAGEIDHSALTYSKEKLDDGGSAQIFLGNYKQQQVVIKKYEFDAKSTRRTDKVMQNEWKILRACFPSRYVVKPIAYCMRPPLIVLEYVENGALDEYMKREALTWLQRVTIANDIAMGLLKLLEAGYVHKDIKCANVLVTKDLRAKINDFDLSCKIGSEASRECHGTDDYLAPECVMGDMISPQAADVYSFGMVLLELALGGVILSNIPENSPPSLSDYRKWFEKVQSIISDYSDDWPQEYSMLVYRCLNIIPAVRPSMATVQKELSSLLEQLKSEAEPDEEGVDLNTKKVCLLRK